MVVASRAGIMLAALLSAGLHGAAHADVYDDLHAKWIARPASAPPLAPDDPDVAMIGTEAAGHGLDKEHAASLAGGSPGILHGNKTYLLQDEDGQITEAHSISAGLDYPGIGPEHSWLHEIGRASYMPITDTEALEAFQLCCKLEGIIPALESAHALAALPKLAGDYGRDQIVIVNVSGRGDKDIFTVAEALGAQL